jgi:hypothetical protein
MPISNYPNGFAGGVNIRGIPLLSAYPGDVYWVDSVNGSNGNKGNFDRPFSSIDYAVGRCTANQGDIIMVKPGHVETVTAAGGLDLDVAGIAIVGLGAGSLRPTINFTTVVGADMDVDAANITVVNLLFTGGIDALTGPIDVNAADFAMINFETRDVTGQTVDFIATAVAADRLYIDGWVHRGATDAGADTAITIVGGDGAIIKNFWIDGDFAVAAIENVGTAATNLSVYGDRPCFARTRNAADCIFTAVATATGNIGPNIYARVADHAANFPGVFVGDDMQHFAPLLVVNLDGEAGGDAAGTASTSA